MLQWMGGSRRKVTCSRKSTHNRQKQYFEQKKRQQQTIGLENNTDERNKRTHFHEEPRSLDILSLMNLATTAQQDLSSQKHGSQLETISPKMHSAGLQNVPSAHRGDDKLDAQKIPVSINEFASENTNMKPNEHKAEDQNDVLFLDLLGDDGPKSSSEGRSAPEAHVAFSVEGLGKVGIETPIHSPRLPGRAIPSSPKASRRIQTSEHLKSIPYDLQLELVDLASLMRALVKIQSMMLLGKANHFTKGYPSFPSKAKTYEAYDNGFGDLLSKSSRTVFEACQRCDVPVPSAPYSKHLSPEKDYNCISFDWERSHADNKSSDFDCMFSPPTWPFLGTEDAQDTMSLLSEESCSSTASNSVFLTI